MRKINTNDLTEENWSSPKGKFAGASKELSEALGRRPLSTDLNERHPFDVEMMRLAPGQTPYPYHRAMGILPCDFRQGRRPAQGRDNANRTRRRVHFSAGRTSP